MTAPTARDSDFAAASPLARWTRGLNAANVSAGLSVIVIYAAGPLPLYFAAVAASGLEPSAAHAGAVAAFATAGFGTIWLCLRYGQPLAVGWSMLALVYIVAASERFAMEELAGACLVTAVIITAMALTGTADRLARLLPVPIIMAVLAGSGLHYCSDVFVHFQGAPVVVAVPLVAYIAARAVGRSWLPPIAAALVAGLPVALLAGPDAVISAADAAPSFVPIIPYFNIEAIIALVPLMLSASLLGNLQGFAVLEMNGFRPPRNATTLAVGIMSFLHALFAAPPASMQRAALTLLAGEESGPARDRHNAAIIASVGAIFLAVFAVAAIAVVAMLPSAFIVTLIGIVLFPIVLEALQRSLGSDTPTAAFMAFAVTVSGITFAGLDASFWGLLAGVAVGAVVERKH